MAWDEGFMIKAYHLDNCYTIPIPIPVPFATAVAIAITVAVTVAGVVTAFDFSIALVDCCVILGASTRFALPDT